MNNNTLAESLTQEYEGSGGEGKLKLVDPVVETPMVLNIEQITLYENNPRTFKNPKYDEIKASIKAEGLKQPLCVTRRPGDDKYFVEVGGNTRLSILRELFQETSDHKYTNVSVIFRPWKDDTNIMVSHLIENELRGEMCFVDTAKAICTLKETLEVDLGKSLSWRKFENVLIEQGLPYSHSQVSRMRFLVEHLLPLLPKDRLFSFGSHHTQIIQSAISEAKKHYKGDLDFIDYYECSIKSFFKLFSTVDTVASSIISLVQPEPKEVNCAEKDPKDEPNEDVKDKVETDGLDQNESSEGEVVQAEPQNKAKPEILDANLARLQAIIRLRAENYDLACCALNEFCVGPRDDGVGFSIDPDRVKEDLRQIFVSMNSLLNPTAYFVNLYKLNELDIEIQKTIMLITNNIHQMLMYCKLLGPLINNMTLNELNNSLVTQAQTSLDDE